MDVIAADTERDYYMSAEEAKAYGLIDACHHKSTEYGETAINGRKK